jgi:phage terminase large subunit-like protein
MDLRERLRLAPGASAVEALLALPEDKRLRAIKRARQGDVRDVLYGWGDWARAAQTPPEGEWRIWLLLAGRGFGKTRCGAEFVRARIEGGEAARVALVGATAADARAIMVEGESGLIAACPPDKRPHYQSSTRLLIWPDGAIATVYSADEPDRLRGPQHDLAWCDELASWRYPEAFDMLMFGLRLGRDPRAVVTTTPRPTRLIKTLLGDPTVALSRGTTHDNYEHLAPGFLAQIIRKYEGTRLGRQEIDAEVLEDVPGALWSRGLIEAARARAAPPLSRVVVAIDPAASASIEADETGIIVAGRDERGQGWVLGDLSGHYSPTEWARTAIAAYRAHAADRVVAEINNGGDMVEATLRVVDPAVSFAAVRASRGKAARAEPVAALYEQGRVHHVGAFAALEDQMCALTPDRGSGSAAGVERNAAGFSPDRVDALVWALTYLLIEPLPGEGIFEIYRQQAQNLPRA